MNIFRFERLSCCCLLGFILILGNQAAVQGQGTDDESIKFLTYNIRYLNNRDGEDIWENRKQRVVEVIQQADVIGLQETVKEQFDYIKEHTPEFNWYGVGRDDGKQRGEMTPIGVRKNKVAILKQDSFWLSPNPDEVGKAGWDAALPRIASWALLKTKSGREFYFVNTHFDHRGSEARLQSGKLLRSWLEDKTGKPAVLLGDLNATITDAPLRAMLDSNSSLRDSRKEPGVKDAGPDTTWNGFKQLAQGRRIDHVLVTGKVQVQNYITLNPKTKSGRFASDHLPILATIKIE